MIRDDKPADPYGLTMLVVMLLLLFSGFYACWNQVVLRKTIRRNFDYITHQFLSDENP
jgi:hypothetical protein